MLVKSPSASDHISHLDECFRVLERHNMKLNPTICSLGIRSGKFLGFFITRRGIEVTPEQIRAFKNLPRPQNLKDIQKLTGKVAALTRFISRSSDNCLPLFDLLKGNKKFEWNEKCAEAFEKLKFYLSSSPIHLMPKDKEVLYLYMVVSDHAMSLVLIREEENIQRPVYYVSKTLLDAETRYPIIEKLALTLITSARKLQPYFQCHTISVVTTFPLKLVLSKPELFGRLAK